MLHLFASCDRIYRNWLLKMHRLDFCLISRHLVGVIQPNEFDWNGDFIVRLPCGWSRVCVCALSARSESTLLVQHAAAAASTVVAFKWTKWERKKETPIRVLPNRLNMVILTTRPIRYQLTSIVRFSFNFKPSTSRQVYSSHRLLIWFSSFLHFSTNWHWPKLSRPKVRCSQALCHHRRTRVFIGCA